jgi:hypothetical protein
MLTYFGYANFRYCDCKIYAFNDILFNLGWKHSRYDLYVTSKILSYFLIFLHYKSQVLSFV